MKSFKVRDGKLLVDGVLYSQSPSSDVNIRGKFGRIHSINIQGTQFFPQSGVFNDGTIKVTNDSTGIVEETKPTKVKKVAKPKTIKKK